MLACVIIFAVLCACVSASSAEQIGTFENIAVPVGHISQDPFLHVAQDGRLVMSWTEVTASGSAVMISDFEDGTWTEPRTVTQSTDLFVNWADFPSVSSFSDGTLITHWLQTTGPSYFDYNVQIALSRDAGASWSAPIVPHLDGTQAQHGFVTLVPLAQHMVAVWLDGRAYDGDLVEEDAIAGQMQFRSAVLSSDGTSTPDIALDVSTCSCCQTDAAVAEDSLLVVYRDRTEAEIRDIALVRLSDGEWSAPMRVHEDNWEIPGCPVNGPSISAKDRNVVVAWFTAAGGIPAVKVARSDDSGASFRNVVRIDRGDPVGRVDTLMLEDGTAVVSWVEWNGQEEVLLICRMMTDGCESVLELASNSEGSSINFPKLAATPEALFIAWTQPLAGGGDTIRMLRARR